MAAGAVLNAMWDLWAKSLDKPLWKLLVDLEPAQVHNSTATAPATMTT